jgi:hypothetical protein
MLCRQSVFALQNVSCDIFLDFRFDTVIEYLQLHHSEGCLHATFTPDAVSALSVFLTLKMLVLVNSALAWIFASKCDLSTRIIRTRLHRGLKAKGVRQQKFPQKTQKLNTAIKCNDSLCSRNGLV